MIDRLKLIVLALILAFLQSFLLEQVDMLQQKALGACDVAEDNHMRIQDLIDDLIADIVEFDSAE